MCLFLNKSDTLNLRMMRIVSIIVFVSLFLIGCQFKEKAASADKVVTSFTVPANKAYAEPFITGNPGVSIPVGWPETKGVVSNWDDTSRSVVWYLYQKKGSYDFFFDTKVDEKKELTFDVTISACSELGFKERELDLGLVGKGAFDTVFVTSVNIPQTGYYRYELKPTSAIERAITIRSLLFNALEADGQVNHTNYQSSPSVHLSFSSTAKTTRSYDWIYEEIMVPEGEDPLATYYMSLGFYRGYMGIQTNSATERRVLFSVWDSKDADHDKSMKDADFVTLVDKDEATTVNSFGNEGTGGQSYVKSANWKTGKPVKFLMNVRKLKKNTVILSAWYCVDETEGWKYVATWRAPHEQRMFDGFYSFIENYGYTNGQISRKAYYYNAWGKEDATGKWINFNKVGFSNTDGAEGQRMDYEQGVAPEYPERFYMASGGYTPTLKTANEIELSKNAPQFDISTFEKRVDQALKNESKYRDTIKKEVRGK